MTDSPKPVRGRAARPTDEKSVARLEALEAWRQSLSNTSSEEIVRVRNLLGLSNDDLRGRLKNLGWDLTPDSLATILAKKRKHMPVSDLLLFAQALNVPPVALMFPVLTNGSLALSPVASHEVSASSAGLWLSGKDATIAEPVSAGQTTEDFWRVADILELLEFHQSALRTILQLNSEIIQSESGPTGVWRELLASMRELAITRRMIATTYREAVLPDLPDSLKFLDDRTFVAPTLPIESLGIFPQSEDYDRRFFVAWAQEVARLREESTLKDLRAREESALEDLRARLKLNEEQMHQMHQSLMSLVTDAAKENPSTHVSPKNTD
jgi:hypothetical protein